MDGRVDEAVHMLQSAIASNANDGPAHLLLCRAYFSEEQTDDAVRACEAAVRLMPKSSEAKDWMGRAYGVKASGAGPLTGLKLAHKVRESFESAVSLDPRNAAAADDLAEYYIGAPSVVGGGLDKADALAGRIEASLPQTAHRIRGLAAEKRKDNATAEREFLAAVAVSHAPDAWVDLGGFYQRTKMNDKAVDALKNAIAADKTKGPSLVDAASYLIDMHTASDVAMKALREYLSSSAKTDAAPVIHVHLLLATLLKNNGDAAGAKIEVNKALELGPKLWRSEARAEGALEAMRVQTTLRIAMGVMVLAFAGDAYAQISLSSAVDLALKNDPRVRMAQASVMKADAVLTETRDVYIPNLGIKGGYGASGGVPLSVPVVFSIASESLLFNFSQKDNIRAAEAGLKAAKLALRDAQEQTIEDVIVTYLNLDNAQQRQSAMKDELGFTSRLTDIIQARIDAGQDTRMELLKARRTAAQIRLSNLNTDDEIANLTDHLSRLLGLPGMQIATVSGSIPKLPELSSFVVENSDGVAVQSAFANAIAKQEVAFGEARYRYRPQVAFGANYSRITTANTSYKTYYPAFQNLLSDNAISVGLEIQIPIMDFEHQAHARESAAEAVRAAAEAQNSRIQFLEGRSKLRHSLAELSARGEVAELDREIAQDQIDTIMIQLGSSSSDPNATLLTPKDEQNARLQERQKQVDLLTAQAELRQSKVNLMRQNGMLGEWLKSTLPSAQTLPSTSIGPMNP